MSLRDDGFFPAMVERSASPETIRQYDEGYFAGLRAFLDLLKRAAGGDYPSGDPTVDDENGAGRWAAFRLFNDDIAPYADYFRGIMEAFSERNVSADDVRPMHGGWQSRLVKIVDAKRNAFGVIQKKPVLGASVPRVELNGNV